MGNRLEGGKRRGVKGKRRLLHWNSWLGGCGSCGFGSGLRILFCDPFRILFCSALFHVAFIAVAVSAPVVPCTFAERVGTLYVVLSFFGGGMTLTAIERFTRNVFHDFAVVFA